MAAKQASTDILLLPGDGIGPEVTASATQILSWVKTHHIPDRYTDYRPFSAKPGFRWNGSTALFPPASVRGPHFCLGFAASRALSGVGGHSRVQLVMRLRRSRQMFRGAMQNPPSSRRWILQCLMCRPRVGSQSCRRREDRGEKGPVGGGQMTPGQWQHSAVTRQRHIICYRMRRGNNGSDMTDKHC